jgi:hypothetical protein
MFEAGRPRFREHVEHLKRRLVAGLLIFGDLVHFHGGSLPYDEWFPDIVARESIMFPVLELATSKWQGDRMMIPLH